MGVGEVVDRAFSVLYLTETRSRLRTWWARILTGSIASVYLLVSMLTGQMLILTPIRTGYVEEVVYGYGATQWWNYPGVLIVQPWGIVALPFFPTVAMIVVSAGVGLGMGAAVVLGIELIREHRQERRGPVVTSSIAGLTPAMIALVTLGACCSTTAASAAGLGVVAQASGTTINNLVLNNWYLGVFQIVVLGVALVAQEQLFVTYGRLFSTSAESIAARTGVEAPAPGRGTSPARAVLRAALLAGGVTWSLAMLVAWTAQSPLSASSASWVEWLLAGQLVALTAVLFALFPDGMARITSGNAFQRAGRAFRAGLLAGGLLLLAWWPPPLPTWGFHGLGNEWAGAVGLSSGWGAVGTGPVSGLALALRWGLQYLLLGTFAVVAAVAPRSVVQFLSPRSAGTDLNLALATDEIRPAMADPAVGESSP